MSYWDKILGGLTEPPTVQRPLFKYVMLVFTLLLLAMDIHWRLTLPPDYRHDPYGNGVVTLMLLLNILAFQFRWPTFITVALRLLALSWLAFGAFYVFYWSHILYQ